MEDKDPMLKQVRAKVNDKDHEVLYKSPGSNRGSNGRTYDWIQAKTKEEAADLIDKGWSISEEEAYELADALEAGKKGKKTLARRKGVSKKDAEEEEAEEDADDAEEVEDEDDEEDEILAAPKKAKKAKKKGK